MKKRAFSLAEIIVSITILILSIFPILKINSRQIKIIKKLELSNSSLNLFSSLNTFLLSENILIDNNRFFEFRNYTEIESSEIFKGLNLKYYPKQDFTLRVFLKNENVNFFHNILVCKIINLEFSDSCNYYTSKIIKFED